MDLKIALAGNPNSGKTTLFNALTGSNQFVGNWPGVTVEKKEGKLKKHDGVIVTDLPGIYSLSPYTLEEVVARNYLIGERPDVILNIVDGTNLERNLYLTTQLTELGIPVIMAINMMDVVKKSGDKINIAELSRELGVKIVEISALKGEGIMEAAEAAIDAAKNAKTVPQHTFSGAVEHALAHIEEAAVHNMPEEQQRWYAIKIFERDDKVLEQIKLNGGVLAHIEEDIKAAEKELDDDAESIITNERYVYIASILKACYKKKNVGKLSTSDKIDRVVTNRWLGLPIFAAVMFLVYYISMVSVGTAATDWMNDGVFGDGWHLFGIGSSTYSEAADTYGDSDQIIKGFVAKYGDKNISAAIDTKSENYDEAVAKSALEQLVSETPSNASVTYQTENEETLEATDHPNTTKTDLKNAVAAYLNTNYKESYGAPDTSTYGVWVPGIPVLVGNGLEAAGAADWLSGLINDGIVAGVGAVLGFVPQMLVLFLLLAFLEACGYMSRIAFVLDRVFRKFGLSGKSFIPMLIGVGCGVPGVMASRTIENERDRRMTIMTTTFIPCGAKVPFIAMIAGALFGGSAIVSTSAYFIGMAAIVISGIILKKTKMFSGEPAPFVMELPAYHWPTVKNVLRSMWERGWSFIKKAGTIILLSTIVVWFTTYFGFVDGTFRMLAEDEINSSILAAIGGAIAWIFKPLGWGTWEAAVASITGLVAKENIVGTMGILYGASGNVYATLGSVFTGISAYSFLVFNLLCAPCFAAIGAIKHEMNSAKWTWFAIAYQCGFAYVIALMINQFGGMFTGNVNVVGLIFAFAFLAGMIYMLVRPYKEATKLTAKVKVK
ncbi:MULTISPECIES: ferrous iron transport protein B [Caproicibacterium]|jgi:ferrous iron transport protein B|uniref:Ferrous iron transport protein B n=1 Tax=Caproicibacterium lactatifermentans TaxID=2666138 RepID=A0A859DP42_9FIRM|nr:ferrous iron transport protein B [Caproicibacterium lactatifermentans]ARP50474.1 ferrous iron transport protein B [Ruminococcaceae bacterium CPB6]QKN23807.1 ferrous iron transport protein B [Caproicibacterium lactatifermentans]QKO29557.1 ferrous iron transport protein B [Caproicibacterium lactatifermentans]